MKDTIIAALLAGGFTLAGAVWATISNYLNLRQQTKKEMRQEQYKRQKELAARREEIYVELLRAMRIRISAGQKWEPQGYLKYYEENAPVLEIYAAESVITFARRYYEKASDALQCQINGAGWDEFLMEAEKIYHKVLVEIRREIGISNFLSCSSHPVF